MRKSLSSILIGLAIASLSNSVLAETEGATPVNPNNQQASSPDKVRTRIYNGIGPEVEIVTPEAILRNLRVRLDAPDGVDEQGKPITYQQRKKRQIRRKITGYFLDNYNKGVKEGKVKPYEGESQLEYWKRKTEETKAYIKEHGPITTKRFTHPGSDPIESQRYYLPSTRLTYKDGKFVPIYDKEDPAYKAIQLHPAQAKREEERKALEEKAKAAGERRTLVEQTRVMRKITGIDEAQDAFARGEIKQKLSMKDLDPYAEIQRKKELARENSEKAKEAVSTTPVELPREKTDEELLREQFHDAPHSFLGEKVLQQLLGIKEAYAEDKDFSIKSNKHFDKFKTGILEENTKAHNKDFENFAEEARRQNEEVRNRYREMRKDGEPTGATKDNCPTCSKTPFEDAERILREREKKLAPKKSLKDFSEASLVIRDVTKNKDYSKYKEDTEKFLEDLSNPKFSGSIYKSLEDTLKAHPEIRDQMPDIDKRMEAIRLGQKKALENMTPEEKKKYEITYIFISYSMGDEALADIFRRTAGKMDTQLVMRGFPEGMTFAQGFKRYKSIIEKEKLETLPNFTVDPPLFQEYNITQVPAVARVQGVPEAVNAVSPKRSYPELIAKVTGLASDEWLKNQIEEGQKGDLGNRGNVFPIAEPDLIEVMKARVAAVDWQKKQEEAFNRYWDNRNFDVLPLAQKTKESHLDPSITVPADIKDIAGNILHAQGSKVNPLDVRPFTKTLVIFNGARCEELLRVEEYLREHNKAGLNKPTFIATAIDKTKGWDAYIAVSDRFDSHIYFLVPEIKRTWDVTVTPTVIWADNNAKHFVIRELGPLPDEEERVKKELERLEKLAEEQEGTK